MQINFSQFAFIILMSIPLTGRAFGQDHLLVDRNGDGEIRLMAFGDSIARGTGDFTAAGKHVERVKQPQPGQEAGFPLRVEAFLNIGVDNQGVPGERTLISGIPRLAAKLVQSNPDVVILQTGTNDSLNGIGKWTFFRALQTMVNMTRARNAELVLTTIPPSCCNHSSTEQFTSVYNSSIKRIARDNNSPMANVTKAFFNICGSRNNCKLLNLPEGLHPNSDGYDVMGEVITAKLLNIDVSTSQGIAEFEQAINLQAGTSTLKPNP